MREVQRNTRYACSCGRFVRARGVTATGYVCTACGPMAGTAREVIVGHSATVVDVLFSTGGRGHVAITDGQEELPILARPDTALLDLAGWLSGSIVPRVVKARKSHHCNGSEDTTWAHGCYGVRPGDRYLNIRIIIGHGNFATLHLCELCAEGYTGLPAFTRREA